MLNEVRRSAYREKKLNITLTLYEINNLCNGLRRAIILSSSPNKETDIALSEDFRLHLGLTREEAMEIVNKFQPLIDEENIKILDENV